MKPKQLVADIGQPELTTVTVDGQQKLTKILIST